VRTLVDGPMRAGHHNLTWRGNDDAGRSVGSGLYLVEMRTPQWRQIRKVMLLK
jgi:flagellar hook assembly protein FlgD